MLDTFSSAPRLKGDNFDHMVQVYTKSFGPFTGEPLTSASRFDWSADFWTAGALTLLINQYSFEWRVRGTSETKEWLSIVSLQSGAMDVRIGNRTSAALPGDILLAKNLEPESFLVRGDQHASEIIRMDWAVIAQMITAHLGFPLTGSLDLSPIVDRSSQSGRVLGHLVQAVITGMRDGGFLLRSPLALTGLTQALAEIVIRTVPHRLSMLLDTKPSLVAPWHVRRAIEFMHAHIDKPITMSMVAGTVGVSIRALENGFRVFKSTTPAVYLRVMRLGAARADLLDPFNQLSVKEVCLKWGFVHFGRFSSVYKATYGESPSETRKRAGMR